MAHTPPKPRRRAPAPRVICPRCGANYGPALRRPGDRCGDLSWHPDLAVACPGVVVVETALSPAEWNRAVRFGMNWQARAGLNDDEK